MPEGDTILRAARRIEAVLVGRVPDEITLPQPRHSAERWDERLAGRTVRAAQARGKHLLLHFDGDLVLHSHLRMTGAWGIYRRGERWRRSPRRAWLVIRCATSEVVQFDGPVLELMTQSRTRLDQRLAGLGPDLLADAFDETLVMARLREDDPTRPIGDALLDQRTLAGVGNMWKAEACFAAGVDPFRPTGQVGDDEVLAIVRAARAAMRESVYAMGGRGPRSVYGRGGRPCLRCGQRILSRGQGESNRITYWCPGCQA